MFPSIQIYFLVIRSDSKKGVIAPSFDVWKINAQKI